MSTLILSRGEVERLLPMPACIGLMRDALASLARGEVIHPLRTVVRVPDSPNVFALMPAYSRALNALAAKVITVYPGNHGTAVDSHQGAVLLFDGADGSLRAIMDNRPITAIRTAAVSGVATRLLAREEASTLAILGAGVQGNTHIDAMMAVRPFERVVVWSRNAARARALAARAKKRLSARIETAPTAEAAVRDADVVCTVTASREPVLRGAWLRAGAHVNAVGASLPAARELDTEAVRRARVFVDRRESAMNEAGDLLIPMREGAIGADHIVGEIGELLTGAVRARERADEITLFKSLGLAVEDLACAQFLLAAAERERVGTHVDLDA